MAGHKVADSVNAYIRGFPPTTQKVLEDLRAVIWAAAPEAVETISYAIPTFDLNGRHLVHFAGYERHVGFYPTPEAIAAFQEELGAYETAKGSVRFPLDRPLPVALITRMVEFRVKEIRGLGQDPAGPSEANGRSRGGAQQRSP